MTEGQKLNHFFVDAKKYETAKTALTGAEIKAIAGVAANYQLFLEEEGDKPDKAIGDGEAVNTSSQFPRRLSAHRCLTNNLPSFRVICVRKRR